jgi:hypothetical protein
MIYSPLGRRSGDERRRRSLSLSVAGEPVSLLPAIARAVSYDPRRVFGVAA